MKREWVLLSVSVALSMLIALGLIRWLAPTLLGGPSDLHLVQVNNKVPPFYEGVFRKADYENTDYILKDPFTRVRAKPLYPVIGGMGPTDILGFRNLQVPNIATLWLLETAKPTAIMPHLRKTGQAACIRP